MSRLSYASVLAVSLAAILASTTAQAQGNRGWWVVLGSVASPDNNFTSQTEAAVRNVEAAARRCGLQPFYDFSSKFSNFAPGYTVVVAGAYGSKPAADRVLSKAKECLPDAYMRLGVYAGE